MSKCEACGEAIEFVRMTSGRMNPVNLKVYTVVTDKGEAVRGRESHFATCPAAEKFRTKKPGSGRDGTKEG
jgi:hypothetical protein